MAIGTRYADCCVALTSITPLCPTLQAAADFNVREHVVPPVGQHRETSGRDVIGGSAGEGQVDHAHLTHGRATWAK